MSVSINMKDLLEAGVHYGHQVPRWNPKMKPFIFGERNGIHIIDLQHTVKMLKTACEFLENVVTQGGHVLFVGTKRIARELVKEQAERCGMYYVNHRWLGGTLTNYNTIRQSIHKLKKLEKMAEEGIYDKLLKKEVLAIEREKEKLERYLGGIKDMPGIPHAVFVMDSKKDNITIKECKILGIPVVAIVDTNCDPESIDFPIPGNDDSFKSISYFITQIAQACLEGKMKQKDMPIKTKESQIKEGIFRDDAGHSIAVEKKASNMNFLKEQELSEDTSNN